MRRLAVLLVVTLAVSTGCRWPWEPKAGPITGSISYPDGTRVWRAEVAVDQGDTTFTGPDGSFFLPVPAGAESVTVRARDGFTPGRAYSATRAGSVRVPVGKDVIIVRIVLTEETPI